MEYYSTIARTILRRLLADLGAALTEVPAVALLGPRQAGKTTLALVAAKARPSLYLDLESEGDRAKLAEPELYLAQHADKLVILDEIQRTPHLFRHLRGLIDKGRRGKRGLAPRLERGFHLACESVQPERRLIVYGGKERFALAADVEAVSLNDLCEELSVV